jgi:hypothetical protein
VLEGLALQSASGALAIDGTPSGLVYLDRGHITFARTSWSPDLGTRLSGMLPPTDELQDLLLGADLPDASLGDLLVERGLVTRADLRETLESVIIDAVLVLTVPLAEEEAGVTDIRLEAPRSHWAGSFCRVRVDAARAQAATRAGRMARYTVPRSTCLELRDLGQPAAVLSRAQWAVASRINGSLTAWDLAWRCGLALCDTFEAIGSLAEAGLCVPCPEAPSPEPPSIEAPSIEAQRLETRRLETQGLETQGLETQGLETQRLETQRLETQGLETQRMAAPYGDAAFLDGPFPEQVPQDDGPAGAGLSAAPVLSSEPPPMESLRRVLDGLRRLS